MFYTFSIFLFFDYSTIVLMSSTIGLAHTDLINFLESSLPQKKKKLLLGVNDSKLAGSLSEANLGIQLVFGGVVTEVCEFPQKSHANDENNLISMK